MTTQLQNGRFFKGERQVEVGRLVKEMKSGKADT